MRFRQSRYAKHDMMAKIKEKRMGNVENIVKDKDILLELKEKEEILWGEVVRVGQTPEKRAYMLLIQMPRIAQKTTPVSSTVKKPMQNLSVAVWSICSATKSPTSLSRLMKRKRGLKAPGR